VVRERRRISALARTASALDERAQAAEKAAEANEAALRSYMNDQRRELEAITQSQHDQILSLMDLVKDRPEHETADDTVDGEVDRAPVRERQDSRLLVLANERISLLERQIEALREEADKVDSYRERIDELNAAVSGKVQENEDFQEDISGLRTVLRQIRELIVNHGNGDTKESDHTNAAVLGIINDALHPSQTAPGRSKKRSPTLSGQRRGPRNLTPRVKKHVELMHTSDSGDDGEAPGWAAEIMTDLALIAKGQIPPSLEPLLQDSLLDEPPSAILASESMASTSNAKRPPKHASSSPLPRGRAERRAMSKDIAAQLDKIVIPGTEFEDNLATPPADEGLRQSASSESNGYKSVFERLISPSHYTGTQKDKFQAQQAKKTRPSGRDPASKLLDDILQGQSEPNLTDSSAVKDRGLASSKTFSDYTQQDVFERLQRTTTQAYAVKHVPENHTGRPDDKAEHFSPPMNRNIAKDPGERSMSTSSVAPTPVTVPERNLGYTSQDVFERLQKTTTEAYAKKTGRQEH